MVNRQLLPNGHFPQGPAAGILTIMMIVASAGISAGATSVSDNDYSETLIDESAGDVLTEDGHVINETQAAQQLEEEIQTNAISGWPEGPAITAASAVLLEADTGTVLYAKDIHEQLYPASTTKLLTCLLAVENLNLDDDITFSASAIAAVPADGSNIGMSVGETITVEQCLYGLMVGSGNECANALAEAVSGSIDAFVDLMNARTAELGCTDSHFANANGLHDEEHYTSAYDLALIAQAFFDNADCRVIGGCASYTFTATDTQPDEFTLTNKHELVTGSISYNGIIGGKTGYTSQAHENLVTGCEQDGMTLICVVMREDDPAQFEDTVTLFDYGYDNFSLEEAQDYTIMPTADASEYLLLGTDLLGSSTPALSVSEDSSLILPKDTELTDVTAIYGTDGDITYYYGPQEEGVCVGTAVLIPSSLQEGAVLSTAARLAAQEEEEETGPGKQILSLYISEGLNGAVYVNVSAFLVTAIAVYAAFIIIQRLRRTVRETRERARQRRRRARRTYTEHNGYEDHRSYERPDEYYDDYQV